MYARNVLFHLKSYMLTDYPRTFHFSRPALVQ